MSAKDSVLTVYEDLKRRILGIKEGEPEPAGLIYSLMQVGHPLRAEDFRNPASPFDVKGDNETAEQYLVRRKAAMNTSMFLNKKIRLDHNYMIMPGSSDINDTWKLITESATPGDDVPSQTEAAKQRIAAASAVLMDPETFEETPAYKRYVIYKIKARDARNEHSDAYWEARKDPLTWAAFATNAIPYIEAIDSAESDWNTLGFKKKIDAARSTIDAEGINSLEAVINLARSEYKAWRFSVENMPATLPYTYVLPSNWAEPNTGSSGWTSYGFSSRDTRSEHSESTRSWGGSGRVGWGFWSTGVGAGGSKTHIHDEFSLDGLQIHLTYGVATIIRPWLATILLNVRGWKILGQKDGVISNGTKIQENPPPEGSEALWLPALPTQMVIVKNVRVKSQGIKNFHDFMQANSGGSARFGWGPFSFGGSARWSTSETSHSSHMEGEWLVVDGAQLIGYVLEVMPKSPIL